MALHIPAQVNLTNLQAKLRVFKTYLGGRHPLKDFFPEDNLKLFKASDANKDGEGDLGLLDTVFDLPPYSISPNLSGTNLKKNIMNFFESELKDGRLILIPYTRIKIRHGLPEEILDKVKYDKYIHDCGPNYTPNGKAPVVTTVGGNYPTAATTVGNRFDTGPSSRRKINTNFGLHTISTDVMNFLGYSDTSLEIKNQSDNFNNHELKIGGQVVDINTYAIGNKEKNKKSGLTSPVKKKFLFTKSLGDTLIVYYWLALCHSVAMSTALLTCDCVVALQAYMFSKGVDNCHIAYNYVKQGEKKITHVYYQGSPQNYSDLCIALKLKLKARYAKDIEFFTALLNEGGDALPFSFGETTTYTSKELMLTIIEELTEIHEEIEGITITELSTEVDYSRLKKYELMSLIKSGKPRETPVLIRSRNGWTKNIKREFCGIDKTTSFHKIVVEMDIKVQSGGGLDEDHLHDELGVEAVAYNRSSPKVVDDDNTYSNIQTDVAIYHLVEYIYDALYTSKLIYIFYFKVIGLIPDVAYPPSKNNYDDWINEGTLYDILTYHFDDKPDYSNENITSLIESICDEYITEIPVSATVSAPATPAVAGGLSLKVEEDDSFDLVFDNNDGLSSNSGYGTNFNPISANSSQHNSSQSQDGFPHQYVIHMKQRGKSPRNYIPNSSQTKRTAIEEGQQLIEGQQLKHNRSAFSRVVRKGRGGKRKQTRKRSSKKSRKSKKTKKVKRMKKVKKTMKRKNGKKGKKNITQKTLNI